MAFEVGGDYAGVAQEFCAFGAHERGASEAGEEGLFVWNFENFLQIEIVAGDGCGKVWEGGLFGTDVVGADFLANVAAKDPVADFGTQVFWDYAFVFDC